MNRYLFLTFIAATGFAHSAILIQDNFDDASTSATINGRTPSLNLVNSNNWVARTTETSPTSINGNGSGGISMATNLNQMGGISLGTDYFTTNPGIYQLSFTISHPSNYGSSWVGFGFTGGLNVSQNFTHVDNAAGPWMFYRANGEVIVRSTGPGGSFTLTTNYAAPDPQTFMFELDTTNPQWSYNLYVNGQVQDLNGSTAGTAFTYAAGTNPAITHLAIGTGSSTGSGTSTGDNFTFALVPEPSHAVMLVASAGMLALRRRRC